MRISLISVCIEGENLVQLGRSGRKWEGTNNDLCLLINLSIEALTQP